MGEGQLSARFLQALRDEITSSLDPKIMLSSLASGTSRILGATRCSVVEVDPLRHPGRGFVFTAVDDPSIEGYSLDLVNYPEIEAALAENRPILVHLSSKDVIHSFGLFEMRVKQDAIPGLDIPVWFVPNRIGDYEIACSQLCGLGHYRMRGFVNIKSAADFQAFLDQEAKGIPK